MTIGRLPVSCQSALAVCASGEALIREQFTTAWETFQENLGPLYDFLSKPFWGIKGSLRLEYGGTFPENFPGQAVTSSV
jgi:hypothetical protein